MNSIEMDYINITRQKRTIPNGSYCIRCNVNVNISDFMDRNQIDIYLIDKLCKKCQYIIYEKEY